MELDLYTWIYIFMKLINTYIIYKLFDILYIKEKVNKFKEWILYFSYFLLNTFIYLCINIPIITLICNILSLILISFNYKIKLKQRLLSVIYIYFILFCIESIVILLTGYIGVSLFKENNYTSIFGIISIQIFSYIFMQILSNLKNSKNGKVISAYHWTNIFIIPVMSLLIIVILFCANKLSNMEILLCIVFLFLINLAAFALYNNALISLENKMVSKMLIQQNNYYEREFELMKTSLDSIKTVRHDLMNHFSIIQILAQKKETEKIREYLSDFGEACKSGKKLVNTGNIIIDSILNFKLQEADRNNIKVQLELSIPSQLSVTSFDLLVILGNLLDNAINASCNIEERKRNINISIRFEKSMLIIKIKNQFNGEILYHGDKIITSNENKFHHGIGISNIRDTVEKYEGILNLTHLENEFIAVVILFLKSNM